MPIQMIAGIIFTLIDFILQIYLVSEAYMCLQTTYELRTFDLESFAIKCDNMWLLSIW